MPAPLSFGLSLPNRAVLFGTPPGLLLRAAEIADASGRFGSVWVGDNFLSKPRVEALVMLSALAARTRTVRLGTVCMATFSMRNPIELALQWASLDVISGGRTILAVCNGTPGSRGPKYANELKVFGVRSQERVARLEEGVAILRGLWSGGPFSHRGEFWEFEDVEVQPQPVQERVPIVIAVNPGQARDEQLRERLERRVARLADGWQTDSIAPQAMHESWLRMQQYATEQGRTLDTASLHLMVNLDATVEGGRRKALAFLDRYYGVGGVSEEKAANWIASGPPDAVAEQISRFIEAGCNLPILRFADEDQLGQLESCISGVLPQLLPAP
jgi:alkanesulfonate monooxygenase SsuD/methylene tetrahydromethanopterin reductase-like flavin-dependent oxidoreductase (luciferase family)